MKNTKVIIIIGLVLCLFPLGMYISKFSGGLSETHSSWGEFGSYFGGIVGSILGFINVILLLENIKLQNKALKTVETQQEKNEMDYRKKEFNIWFQKMLDYKSDIIRNSGKETIKGYEKMSMDMNECIILLQRFEDSQNEQDRQLVIDSFTKYLNIYQHIIYIANGIDREHLDEQNENEYYSCIRNLLSDPEIKMLIIAKYIKEISNSTYIMIEKILGGFTRITLRVLIENRNIGLYAVASKLNIFTFHI